jgi:hypothetical protein
MNDSIKNALDLYFICHYHPGGFLYELLCNNIYNASRLSDNTKDMSIPEIMDYIINNFPDSSWGCKKDVDLWLKNKDNTKKIKSIEIPPCYTVLPEEDYFHELDISLSKSDSDKEITINSISQIIDKLVEDGDLRNKEFDSSFICSEDDDLGFYQQACDFLIPIANSVKTCKHGHKYYEHEYYDGTEKDTCPWCIIKKLSKL